MFDEASLLKLRDNIIRHLAENNPQILDEFQHIIYEGSHLEIRNALKSYGTKLIASVDELYGTNINGSFLSSENTIRLAEESPELEIFKLSPSEVSQEESESFLDNEETLGQLYSSSSEGVSTNNESASPNERRLCLHIGAAVTVFAAVVGAVLYVLYVVAATAFWGAVGVFNSGSYTGFDYNDLRANIIVTQVYDLRNYNSGRIILY